MQTSLQLKSTVQMQQKVNGAAAAFPQWCEYSIPMQQQPLAF